MLVNHGFLVVHGIHPEQVKHMINGAFLIDHWPIQERGSLLEAYQLGKYFGKNSSGARAVMFTRVLFIFLCIRMFKTLLGA